MDSCSQFVADLAAMPWAQESMDTTSEEGFRRSFEYPFFDLVRTKANDALLRHYDGAAKITYQTRVELHTQSGHLESIDGAIVLNFNGHRYVLGFICCKKDAAELVKHTPYQAISYLLKTLNPEFGLKVQLHQHIHVLFL